MGYELVLGVLIGILGSLAVGAIKRLSDAVLWKRREIQFDKEELMQWRRFIVQHQFEHNSSSSSNYLKRQWKNEQRPYRHGEVRTAFPVEKLVDPNSDL